MFLPVLFHSVNCISKSCHDRQKVSEMAPWEFKGINSIIIANDVDKKKNNKNKVLLIKIFCCLNHDKNVTLLIDDHLSPVRWVAIDSSGVCANDYVFCVSLIGKPRVAISIMR